MALHLAVEVHDTSLFALGVDPATGEECFRRRLPHSPAGTAELLARLAPGDTVVLEAIAQRAPGAQLLANRLDASGATVLLADPQRCRLLGFRGKKTDYRDCRGLLSHLRSGELATVWRPDRTTRERRQLSQERHAYNHTITQYKNRILALLREEGYTAPGPELWTAAGEAWLQALSVPAPTRALLLRTWTLLQATLAAKEAQEAAFAAEALADPRAWRLLQLPGFGPATAVMFLGEMGEAPRFPDGKHFTSYAGLDPRVAQSGNQLRGGSISKGGRSQLRWLMVEVAWNHVLADGPEAHHYHRLVRKGKPTGVAITALARHLLVLAHTLLVREEPYRGLAGWSYLRQLADLAGFRPHHERKAGGGTTDLDWARARYRELLGEEPPPRPAAGRTAPADTPVANPPAANPPTETAPAGTAPAGTAPETEAGAAPASAAREATAPAPAAEESGGSTSGAGADRCSGGRSEGGEGKTETAPAARRSAVLWRRTARAS